MALACLLPGLRDMTRSAQADPSRYRITNLGVAPQASGLAEARSRALGVNRFGQVVGWCDVPIPVGELSVTVRRPVLWETSDPYSSSAWAYQALENLVNTSACGWDELRDAASISEHEPEGWIVGYGVFLEGVAERERAFLLIPILPCDADINGDGTVTSADLAAIQQLYGSCAIGEICWADLNGDCVVDNADRAIATSLLSLDCSGESLTEGFAQSSIPLEYIELWLALGGANALISDEISEAAVVACLHHAEPAVGLVNLFALIGQSAEEVE